MARFTTLIIISIYYWAFGTAYAQNPVLQSSRNLISIRDGKVYQSDYWQVDPKIKQDVYETYVKTGETKKISFISDTDSLEFNVGPGQTVRFSILLNGKDTAQTLIVAQTEIPSANFDVNYIALNNDKISIEIPKVSELMNLVLAITPLVSKENGLIYKGTNYYQTILARLPKNTRSKIIDIADSLISLNRRAYFNLKMDAYSYQFDQTGKIVPTKTYDRTGWERTNTLRPYIHHLQNFADSIRFLDLYDANQHYYDSLIHNYSEYIDIAQIKTWLTSRLPGIAFNSYKIILSPLTGYAQSVNWLESDTFKEIHAHVNFPFREIGDSTSSHLTYKKLRSATTVFTELNHAFINPISEKGLYALKIKKAFNNVPAWVDMSKPGARSMDPASCFNEYMNWALVSLWYLDNAPAADFSPLVNSVEKKMAERGFKKFNSFNQFLIELYRHRPPQAPITELYPQIIDWCLANSAENR
ncbi:DUF4932 domain-containing protein [Dyadobacter jiangsuensis]|uniref:DUF4932 domain-containing protein n=1 Tax=Dyadobacter fermentans TaxID=94254 RepID=UPI001CBE3347|nr:DUF4932 domain-containing protein [Dyadobacter fermentans]MBZ1358786.1 DUF4932 domain-containing protein [Dyadobacter fermentans]